MSGIVNIITGFLGFVSWFYLSMKDSSQSIEVASGVLLILLGFGGRDTIIEILKNIKK